MSPYHCYSHWVYTFLCLLLQACRGGRFDYGVEMESTDAPNAPEVKPDEMKQIIEQQVTVCVCVYTHRLSLLRVLDLFEAVLF